ncbi:hypothetical protein ZIOFF_062392 [Zingiber officinale]|uniref:Uncharacterized protein n=1 Tax=Zingiber officinale TaxID=94328 RepID=A0A8J5F511_ZINOF|nr:hypothetical protein ZIOFF_062392 [Zingiber officinale]
MSNGNDTMSQAQFTGVVLRRFPSSLEPSAGVVAKARSLRKLRRAPAGVVTKARHLRRSFCSSFDLATSSSSVDASLISSDLAKQSRCGSRGQKLRLIEIDSNPISSSQLLPEWSNFGGRFIHCPTSVEDSSIVVVNAISSDICIAVFQILVVPNQDPLLPVAVIPLRAALAEDGCHCFANVGRWQLCLLTATPPEKNTRNNTLKGLSDHFPAFLRSSDDRRDFNISLTYWTARRIVLLAAGMSYNHEKDFRLLLVLAEVAAVVARVCTDSLHSSSQQLTTKPPCHRSSLPGNQIQQRFDEMNRQHLPLSYRSLIQILTSKILYISQFKSQVQPELNELSCQSLEVRAKEVEPQLKLSLSKTVIHSSAAPFLPLFFIMIRNA